MKIILDKKIFIFPITFLVILLFFIVLTPRAFAATETLRPNGAGSETSILNQFPSSTFHWDKVDEETPDDGTTFVYSGAGEVWKRDLYALPSHTGSGTINSVTVYARLGNPNFGSSAARISLRTNSTTYDIGVSVVVSYTNYSNTWTTNPNTSSAWTWDEIDALEAGAALYEDSGVSLLRGQQVLMADGSQKNIEDIKVGDEITSYNLDSQKTEKDNVTDVMQGSHDDYLVFNGILKTSLKHVIWASGEFKPAEDIKVGDFLLNSESQEVEVTQIQYIQEKAETYDLAIEKNHNFFANNYLVHNIGTAYLTQVYVVVDYTSDSTPPTVSTLSPADNATAVAVDSNLVITFSEAVDAETGNISLYKTTGDVLVQAFNVATDITGTGTNTITANPTSNLLGETAYYVKIDATAFDDAASNSYAGIADTTTWNFTSADIANPTVSTLSPADNATAVAVDSNLVITFSEAVDAETGNINLYKTAGDVLVQAFNVTTDITGTGTTIITANPTSNLLGETDYYVKIDATAFDDAASNSFAGIADTTTWNFTSADIAAPTVSTLSPTDNATAVAVDSNLIITFSEAVDAETGNINLYKTAGDVLVQAFDVTADITGTGTTIITANPTSNLLGETDYYVKIDATAFDDASSNSFAGIADTTTWNFTSADITAPTRSNGSPSGSQSAGTTQITMSLTTDENATCKYSSTVGTAYGSMTGDFSTTGGTSHSVAISDLSSGQPYNYYVRCQDGSSNANSDDYTISFSVARGGGMLWFSIYSSAGPNGKITSQSGEGSTFPYGSEQTFNIVSDDGYQIRDVLVDGVSIGTQTNYTFKYIVGSHSISATFSKIETSNTQDQTKGQKIIENMTPEERPEERQEEIQELIALINNLKLQIAQIQGLPSAVFTTPLYKGLRSEDVRRSQKLLASKPEIYPEGKVTGYFGPLTQKAVQRFQLKYGVVNSESDPGFGYVGPKTRAKLREVFGN